jgi:oxygen-independent coproporphyrinogen-3 oxidase
MNWTPEAEAAIKKAPPFVRKMARKAVEGYARNRGLGAVTLEIVEEARRTMMGRSKKKAGADHAEPGASGLNRGTSHRQTMHLSDDQRYLANDTGDPLHEAFDHKMAVHAMPRAEPLAPADLHRAWDEMVAADRVRQPVRTLYIHIPFCQGHCLFCGFYQNSYKQDAAHHYVKMLLQEVAQTAAQPFCQSGPYHAVYFGGGTPTSLSAQDIHRLVSGIKQGFPLANDCEITLEGRFHDFDQEKIDSAVDAGINRFSLGVQTFDTAVRKSVGRRAPREKLIDVLGGLRDLGRAVVVIDLIYGLPGQSMDTWERDIETYLELGIDGCDLYQLNIFTGGPLDTAVKKGALPKPATLGEQADYYVRGVRMMTAAHQRRLSLTHWAQNTRERSLYNSFSRGRSECIPLGAGAGGWLGGHMFFLESDLETYTRAVTSGKKPLAMGFGRDEHHLLCRDISYQIELGYCDIGVLSGRHDVDLATKFAPIVTQWEKVGLVRHDKGCLHLTRAGEYWAVNLAQILIDALQ